MSLNRAGQIIANPLKAKIIEHIKAAGPINLAEYMALCLYHPDYGYYTSSSRSSVGGKGADFMTAPEISQIFGEMIGIWAISEWIDMGKPSDFHLVECGVGRGVCAMDVLRAIKQTAPEMINAMTFHAIESSPKHFDDLCSNLPGIINIKQHKDVHSLPSDAPVILYGNEFLDVFPVRQFHWHEKDGLFEVCVGIRSSDDNTDINLCWQKKPMDIKNLPQSVMPASQNIEKIHKKHNINEAILECSAHLDQFCEELFCYAKNLVQHNGHPASILMVDYGDYQFKPGATFHAISNHQKADPLEHPGHADLSAHVAFWRVLEVLDDVVSKEKSDMNVTVHMSKQRDFLCECGGAIRQNQLLKILEQKHRDAIMETKDYYMQKQALISGWERLTGTAQNNGMGDLFKVLDIKMRINEESVAIKTQGKE